MEDPDDWPEREPLPWEWDHPGDSFYDSHLHHTWMIDLSKKQRDQWEEAVTAEQARRLPAGRFGFR